MDRFGDLAAAHVQWPADRDADLARTRCYRVHGFDDACAISNSPSSAGVGAVQRARSVPSSSPPTTVVFVPPMLMPAIVASAIAEDLDLCHFAALCIEGGGSVMPRS